MGLIVYAAAGGAIGAALRFLVGHLFAGQAVAGRSVAAFPWATLSVNVVGCFLMGVLMAWLTTRAGSTQEVRAFLATGILGGFTTFSAFAFDFATLFERGDAASAYGYAAATVGMTIAAVFAGLALARWALA